jgi:hypothetical protein
MTGDLEELVGGDIDFDNCKKNKRPQITKKTSKKSKKM